MASDDVNGDEPIWDECGDDDIISSSREHDDDITRTCWVNILLNTASLVDLPRLDRLVTCMGHETVKEKETGQIGILRGKGGKIERVASDEDDVDVDVDVVVDVVVCLWCCDIDVVCDVLLLLFVFDICLLFNIFVSWFNIGGNDGIEDDAGVDVGWDDKEDALVVWEEEDMIVSTQ